MKGSTVMNITDSTKRAVRTLIQGLIVFVAYAGIVVPLVPGALSSLPYVGGVLGGIAAVSKAVNYAEDQGWIKARFKPNPQVVNAVSTIVTPSALQIAGLHLESIADSIKDLVTHTKSTPAPVEPTVTTPPAPAPAPAVKKAPAAKKAPAKKTAPAAPAAPTPPKAVGK